MREQDFSFLPELVQDLEALIGLPAALKLVERYGGVRVCVPKEAPPAEHELSEMLGEAGAAKLVSVYAGEKISIPRCEVVLRMKRNADIFKKRDEGYSVRDLALAFSLTERHVFRILLDGPDDDRQLRLFE